MDFARKGPLAALSGLPYKARSQVGVWLSLVEHRVRDAGVAGSNPATPTIFSRPFAAEIPREILPFPSLA